MSSEEISKLVQEILKNPNFVIAIYTSLIPLVITQKATMNYKLKRENRVKNCKVTEITPLETIREKRKKPISKEFEDLIYEALTRLCLEVSPESMEIIKKNLFSVAMANNSNYISWAIKYFTTKTTGSYSAFKHNIAINSFFIKFVDANSKEINELKREIISHELMHAASSYKYNDILGSGFHQTHKSGIGINEGYTDLIAKRYFNKGIEQMCGYSYHRNIAEIVETIVGKQKMLNLYFHGNLQGLIKELSKYQSEEKVKQFILDLDTILMTIKKKPLGKEQLILTSSNRVSTFLYNAFSSKIDQNTTHNNLSAYLQESKHFLKLFSVMEENQRRLLGIGKSELTTRNNSSMITTSQTQIYTTSKSKILTRKKDGFINILTITLLLGVVITISITISYLILKVS